MDRKIISEITLMLLSLAFNLPQIVQAEPMTEPVYVKAVPEVVDFGSGYAVGQNFTVAVVIENVMDLIAFNIELNWSTTYIEYLNHVTTVPVEDYPDPIPPSSHPGILHDGVMRAKDVVDETMTDPALRGSAPGTMAWICYLSSSPVLPFSGNGTVAVFTFRVRTNQS